MPPMSISSIGYGAGDHDFPEHANVLRAMIGETIRRRRSHHRRRHRSQYRRLDSRGARLRHGAPARSRRARRHVRAHLDEEEPAGHPAARDRQPEDREALAAIVFAETSTLGLRMYSAERRVQSREFVEVATPHGVVRMKVSGHGGYAPEYEDCRTLAHRRRRPAQADHRRSEFRLSEESQMKILPHHSDLLRQRRAAHRPHLHDDRRRHDQRG